MIYLQLRLLKSCIKPFIHNYQDAPIWRGLTDILNTVTSQIRTVSFAAQICSQERVYSCARTHTQNPEQLELPTSLINSAIHHPKCYIWELGEEGAYNQSDLIITSAKNSQPSISFQQEVTFKKNTQEKLRSVQQNPLEIFNVKALINLREKVGMFQYLHKAVGASCRFTVWPELGDVALRIKRLNPTCCLNPSKLWFILIPSDFKDSVPI